MAAFVVVTALVEIAAAVVIAFVVVVVMALVVVLLETAPPQVPETHWEYPVVCCQGSGQ